MDASKYLGSGESYSPGQSKRQTVTGDRNDLWHLRYGLCWLLSPNPRLFAKDTGLEHARTKTVWLQNFWHVLRERLEFLVLGHALRIVNETGPQVDREFLRFSSRDVRSTAFPSTVSTKRIGQICGDS
jgi:hypothetical protein